ncbi:MAG: GNAT family N-acetyltransferase [Salaquimonas sp.]
MKLIEVAINDDRLLEGQEAYFTEISFRFGVEFDPSAGEDEAVSNSRYWNIVAVDNERVIGCGSLRDLGGGRAEVKRVWVSTNARGKGIARRLMDWLETKAISEGFSTVVLDTNKTLTEAQAMYHKRGYEEISRYNDNPYADHFYEKKLFKN